MSKSVIALTADQLALVKYNKPQRKNKYNWEDNPFVELTTLEVK